MKKFLVMLLAFAMVLCFAACDDGSDTSSTPATSSEATSSEAASSEAASSEAASSEAASSEEESSEVESSEEESSEPELTEDGEEIASFISQYINWSTTIGKGAVNARATDAAAVQLTHLNVGAIDGTAMIIGFNSDYEESDIYSADGSYDKYEVFVFEYNHDLWGYALTDSYGLDAENKSEISIPDDGYVVAIHSHFADKIDAVKAIAEGTVVTPYGFRGTDALDAEIIYGTATVDGNVSTEEYGDAVWLLEPESEIVSYEQFDNKGVEGYYSTAEVYMMYDENNLYLAVVVDSPYHFCDLTQSNAGNMWSQECIQVNVTSIAPNDSFYIDNDYWDWNNSGSQSVAETTAKNLMRQYGFSVNSTTGEQLSALWQGDTAKNAPEFHVERTEDQLTIYEAAIPWSELGNEEDVFTPESGAQIGISLSINSGRAADDFMNYYLRDGGGVIGRNDWTKIPVITLE